MSIKWDRLDMKGLEKKLDVKALEKMKPVLTLEANKIMTASKRITPVDTGTLRASGHVQKPKQTLHKLSIIMGFGGAASSYALIQHERTDLKHTGRQQSKFLEQPAKEAELRMARAFVKSLDIW